MTPPGVHGGKFALIGGIPNLGKWSVNDTQTLAKAVTSATAFGTATRPAVEEWNGQYENHKLVPSNMPGDLFSFVGYEGPDNDSYGVGETYSGSALVKQLAIDWNWAGGDIIKHVVDFDGHLDVVAAAAASVSGLLDATTPYIPSVVPVIWQYSLNGSVWNTWTNAVSANLTFVNQVQEFVNSSTVVVAIADSKPHLWKGRRPGPLDMTGSVVEQNVDRARFQKGQQIALRCQVDATPHFWEIFWVTVKAFTGITVDRTTGAIIQQTVEFEFNAADQTAGTLGHIYLPDGSTWWPLAQS